MDNMFSIRLSRRVFVGGEPQPVGTVVQVPPSEALDLVNGAAGTLVAAGDAARLRRWSDARAQTALMRPYS